METTKDAYKAKMEAQLAQWTAKLDGLKAKANGMRADAKIEFLKHVDELKAFQVAAQAHITEVEKTASESWLKVRAGMDQKWSQLSGSVEALWTKVASPAAP